MAAAPSWWPRGDLEGSALQAQLVAMAPVQRDDPLGPGPVEPSEEPWGGGVGRPEGSSRGGSVSLSVSLG